MAKSPRVAIALAKARLFCLGVSLALLLTLPSESRVRAVTFAFRGFQWNSLHLVSNSSWIFNRTTGCFKFFDSDSALYYSATSGRLLFPLPVQMIDPGATTVKSFTTSFIFSIERPSADSALGPGLAFIIVPDNVTLGAPEDFIGLLTSEFFKTPENYESDNHTLGVELDIFRNFEFKDTNDNHIGINLASMTSVYSFELVDFSLTSSNADQYKQVWIEYFAFDFRMDVFVANYPKAKPAKPQGSQSGLDLSLLRARMFAGFASANKLGSTDVPYICAWSFSNDGIPAPPIVIGQDATPGAPPPPGPVSTAPPPNGPIAAPSVPPTPTPSPPPPAASTPPPLRAPSPSPTNPPSPPPLSSVPPQGPSSEPPTIADKREKKTNLAVIYVGVPLGFVIGGLGVFVLCCWIRFRSHPLRTFVCHAGGKDGSEKNFPKRLVQRLRKYFEWSNFTIFMDTDNIRYGEIVPTRIFEELARCDVGLVVVTKAFFESKWPMTELITLTELIKLVDKFKPEDDKRKVRLLPLFYELTPVEVKGHLERKTWEPEWENLSTPSHPLDMDKCRQAVSWLGKPRGVVYCYIQRDHDDEYIEKICTVLRGILREERSFPTYLWGSLCSFSCSK